MHDLEGVIVLKRNILQTITGFIIKYIWIFCGLLIAVELLSITYTTTVLMQQSALGVMQSVCGQVSGRVDGVLRLLTGMANDTVIADTSKPLYDRAIRTLPYQESYNLYMVALTDEAVNVVSADEKEEPTEYPNLAYREYMQRLYATGKYQITDALISGDGKNTLNYTIAVPIMKDRKVEGSVFGSIYFQDIEDIVNQRSESGGRDFYLFGEENTIMAGDGGEIYGESFLALSQKSHIFGCDIESIDSSMRAGKSGSFWQWDREGLIYAMYQPVAPTEWSLLYRVKFMSVFTSLFPSLCVKICFYIVLCIAISFMGRRFLTRNLAKVNHLVDRMAVMQKELFQSEQADYDNLLELTQQGLTDQLTGLSTRAILFQKMMQLAGNCGTYGAVVFIDLDDLKRINDNFGHEGGDCALLYFAQVLKEYEQEYGGIAARYGGDEFILVLTESGQKEASEIAEKLCTSLNSTVATKEHSFAIHGSLGISFYPEHGTTPEELICKADLALYTAKQDGKNQCAFYSDANSII